MYHVQYNLNLLGADGKASNQINYLKGHLSLFNIGIQGISNARNSFLNARQEKMGDLYLIFYHKVCVPFHTFLPVIICKK